MSCEVSFGVAALPFAAGCAGAPAEALFGNALWGDMSFSSGGLAVFVFDQVGLQSQGCSGGTRLELQVVANEHVVASLTRPSQLGRQY